MQQKKTNLSAPKFFFDSDSISDQNFVSFSWRAKPENDLLRSDASCRDFGRLRKNDFPHGGELLVDEDQAEWSWASTIGFDPKGPWFDARWRGYFITENTGTLLAKKLAIRTAYSWY